MARSKKARTGKHAMHMAGNTPLGMDHRFWMAPGGDRMAHPSHHQSNEDHGTPSGLLPPDHFEDGGSDHHMGCNESATD